MYLGVERCARDARQSLHIIQVDRRGHFLEELDGFSRRLQERLCDDRRVYTLLQHLLRRTQEAAGKDNDRGRAVARLDVLCRRKIYQLEPECKRGAGGRSGGKRAILEAGWSAWMLLRIVAPSLVTMTSPLDVWICARVLREDADDQVDVHVPSCPFLSGLETS